MTALKIYSRSPRQNANLVKHRKAESMCINFAWVMGGLERQEGGAKVIRGWIFFDYHVNRDYLYWFLRTLYVGIQNCPTIWHAKNPNLTNLNPLVCKDGEPDGQTQLGTPWGHLLGLDEPIISNLGPYRAAALECLSPNRPTIYSASSPQNWNEEKRPPGGWAVNPPDKRVSCKWSKSENFNAGRRWI